MDIERTGLILKTSRVEECVAFYRDVLECPVWFRNEDVTCLGIGESYILVEPLDKTASDQPSPNLILRLNVADVRKEAEALRARGADAWIDDFEWGTICTFFDPVGTKLELMEAHRFRRERRAD
jgi:lactoylglutathione lyase